jgi:MFS family permease
MTTSSTAASPVMTEPRRPFRLPPRAAFLLLASTVVSLLASSSAPTPLYAVYQAEWGFSPITVTVVFGVYALAVLAALLTVGSLSDHVGRRPVLLVAIGVQAATMLVFATAGGVPELLVARVLQGLATGAAVGAIGAGLLDLDRPRGTIANAVSAPLGTAVGSILSGLLVQFLPAPTRTVYLLMFGIFVVQGVGVALMAETSTRRPGGLASLRPRFALPSAARGPLLRATPALVASWALAGFYGRTSRTDRPRSGCGQRRHVLVALGRGHRPPGLDGARVLPDRLPGASRRPQPATQAGRRGERVTRPPATGLLPAHRRASDVRYGLGKEPGRPVDQRDRA